MEIDITLPQQAYAIFESLNYAPCNAIGEFIDNSIQSYMNHREALRKLDKKCKLKIEINLTQDKLEIIDNATGIDKDSLRSGLKPATKPKISEGLSEFGMGLKTASFWISRNWSITTKHFKSNEEFVAVFDNRKIYTEGIEKISIASNAMKNKEHYTKLVLRDLVIDGTSEKLLEELRENLSSMYRHYLRDKEIEIIFNRKKLSFKKYETLRGKKEYGDNKEIEWVKDIDFILSSGKRVHGKAGLLAIGKPTQAGFTYLRRNRVIEGLVMGKKIIGILGTANTKRSQRVFAELNLDDFRVSHTKDKILFGNEIYEFEEKLKEALNDGDIKLTTQAEKFSYGEKTNGPPIPKKNESIVGKLSATLKSPKKNILEINISDFDEGTMRISGNINNFSGVMKEAYEDMYKIENMFRVLIKAIEKKEKVTFLDEDIYEDTEDKKIIRDINNNVEWLKGKEASEGTVSIRGKHDIYYTNFNVIKKVVELNYDKYFKSFFSNKDITLGTLEQLYSYRNNIAHNSHLNQNERNYISSTLEMFIRQLNGKISFA